jgi:hypothetical protein
MQIIEHQANRNRLSHFAEQPRDRGVQQEPLGLWIGGLRRGQILDAPLEIARQPTKLPAVTLHISGEQRRRRALDQL